MLALVSRVRLGVCLSNLQTCIRSGVEETINRHFPSRQRERIGTGRLVNDNKLRFGNRPICSDRGINDQVGDAFYCLLHIHGYSSIFSFCCNHPQPKNIRMPSFTKCSRKIGLCPSLKTLTDLNFSIRSVVRRLLL